MSTQKPTLIFIGDPLCGWTYSLLLELDKLELELRKEFEIVVLPLGTITEDISLAEPQTGDCLRTAIMSISRKTGVEFGQEFLYGLLSDQTVILNSTKPAVASYLVSSIREDISFAFFRELQLAYFNRGKDLNLDSTYQEIFPLLGLDPKEWLMIINDNRYHNSYQENSNTLYAAGMHSVPSIFLLVNDTNYPLFTGFLEAYEIRNLLQRHKTYWHRA